MHVLKKEGSQICSNQRIFASLLHLEIVRVLHEKGGTRVPVPHLNPLLRNVLNCHVYILMVRVDLKFKCLQTLVIPYMYIVTLKIYRAYNH